MQVFDHGIQIETLEFLGVIELLAHRIGQVRVLMQDLQVHLIRPPVAVRGSGGSVVERALGFGFGAFVFSLRGKRFPMKWRVCFPYISVLRILIEYCVKNLLLGAAAAAEAKDLDQRLRQIKAIRQMPGQPFEIDEFSFNVLHRFAAGANQVVMRFEIAVHAQRGRMRSDLPQQPALDEKPQIVVDRSERNGWNATPDRGVNVFRRMVAVGSDDGLIDHLALVRDRQTVLLGQFTELFMGKTHDYRIRIIIKR